MSIYEIETGTVDRLVGTIHSTPAVVGSVPVQQADGSYANAPGGMTLDGVSFQGVSKPHIANATAPDIIAALVTLGLVVDDT